MGENIYTNSFIWLWIGFVILLGIPIFAGLLWAIKNGQFKNQHYARHLALRSGIPDLHNAGEPGDKITATKTNGTEN